MNIKHKILKDFQFLTEDKKIVVLKTGSILEEYRYGTKSDFIRIDKEIVDSNPEFFSPIDWKQELLANLKQNKITQPAQVAKKIIPFIEDMIISQESLRSNYIDIDHDKKLKEKTLELKNIENEYYSKMEIINKKEKKIEQEIEYEKEKIKRREKIIIEKEEELEQKESILYKKEKDLKLREEKLRENEIELKNKELNIDNIILESQLNIDSKQKEMSDKIKKEIAELNKKEEYWSKRAREIEIKELEIIEKEEVINKEIKEKEIELENKIKEIKEKEIELSSKNIKDIVEKALLDFEETIPFQYHRKKY